MKNKPNIVFFLADDLGYGDISCYNPESKIITRNIDKIACEGMRFTDAHSASAVCTPSRYSILTGRYCWRGSLKRSVHTGYERPLIESGRSTIATMLKEQGYKTSYFGKWHLGLGLSPKKGQYIDFNKPLPWGDAKRELEEKIDFTKEIWGGPNDLGFDTFFGTANCCTSQPPYGFIDNNKFLGHPYKYCTEHSYPKGYNPAEASVPDWWIKRSRPGMTANDWNHKDVDVVFTQKAVKYIENIDDCDEPFFMVVSSNACHEPCFEEYVPEFARGKSKAGHRGDLVWLFDWMIGEVENALEKTGKLQNTMIIIGSDNGALPGDRLESVNNYNTYEHKVSGDYRGYKAHIWEGGHREPLIVKYPDYIKSNSTSNELVCYTDLYRTIGSIVGAAITENEAEDSFDLSPILFGIGKNIREHIIHHSQTGVFSIRRENWKLILETESSGGWAPPLDMSSPVLGGKGQLYNLEIDPFEKSNLYDANSSIIQELTDLLYYYQVLGRSN